MTYIEAILLAIIQGITEFLPISSSAHLILLSEFMGSSQNLFYDVSLHLGTLIAVCLYFRSELMEIVHSFFKYKSFLKNQLFNQLFLACIPTLVLGFMFVEIIDSYLRTGLIIAMTTILFGILLFLSTLKKSYKTDIKDLSISDALLIGVAQSLALIPGTSRSGITITAGLFLGLDNKTASKFSFLMAIPTIGAIAIYQFYSVDMEYMIDYFEINILGLIISFLIAYTTIDFFIKFINQIGFIPFIIYRILLGILLLYALI